MGLAVRDRRLLIFLDSLGCFPSHGNETHLVPSNQNYSVILRQSIGDRLHEPGGAESDSWWVRSSNGAGWSGCLGSASKVLLWAVWLELHFISPHYFTYRRRCKSAWLVILVNKKILQLPKWENPNPPTLYLFCMFQCMVGTKVCWLVLLSPTSIAIKSSFVQLSIGSSPQKSTGPKSLNWKVFWQKVDGHRSDIQCQGHDEETNVCRNVQKPFSGSAVLSPSQELLIWCQLLKPDF